MHNDKFAAELLLRVAVACAAILEHRKLTGFNLYPQVFSLSNRKRQTIPSETNNLQISHILGFDVTSKHRRRDGMTTKRYFFDID